MLEILKTGERRHGEGRHVNEQHIGGVRAAFFLFLPRRRDFGPSDVRPVVVAGGGGRYRIAE